LDLKSIIVAVKSMSISLIDKISNYKFPKNRLAPFLENTGRVCEFPNSTSSGLLNVSFLLFWIV